MKPKVLWIEDSARLELANLCGPIYYRGKYDFNLAEDVTTAVRFLEIKKFDAVIVDMRLPPGTDVTWQKLYQQAGSDKVQAQLGLKLLWWLLKADKQINAMPPPGGITPDCVGVFTVESRREIEQDLRQLGIRVFQQKVASNPDTILVELIEQILHPSDKSISPDQDQTHA